MKNSYLFTNLNRLFSLSLLLVLAMSSCNAQMNSGPSNPAGDTSTIRFLVTPDAMEQYEGLASEFKAENPNIDVQIVTYQGGIEDAENLANQGDAFALPSLPSENSALNYLDLMPLMEGDPSFEKDDFWPGAVEGCNPGARQIGLPYLISLQVIYFDSNAFAEANLPVPNYDWTWDDLFLNAVSLTTRATDGAIRYGLINPGSMSGLLGAQISPIFAIADENERLEKLTHLLNRYVTLIEQGVFLTPESNETSKDIQEFIDNRQGAMWLGNLSELDTYRSKFGDAVKFLPFPDQTRGISRCLAISSSSAQPQAAWKWTRFLSGQSGVELLPYDLPAQQSAIDTNKNWMRFSDDEKSVLQHGLKNAWFGNQPLFVELNDAITQVLANKVNLRSELALTLGSSSPQSSSPQPGEPIAVDISPIATSEPISPDAQVISYYSGGALSPDRIKPLMDAFNHSQTKFYVQQASSLYEGDSLSTRVDCFDTGIFPKWDDEFYPQVLSLDSLIDVDPEGHGLISDLPETAMKRIIIDGEIKALPLSSQPLVIYYNPELLNEVGIKPPSSDWTIEEFIMLINAAKGEDHYGFVPYADYRFIFDAYGVRFYDLNGGSLEFLYDSAEIQRITALLRDLYQANVIPMVDESNLHTNNVQQFQMITTKRTVFWSNWINGLIQTDGDEDFLPLPVGRGGRPISFNSLNAFYITKASKNPIACWNWIKFLSTQSSSYEGIPLRRSILFSSQFEALKGKEVTEKYREIFNQIQDNPFIEREEENYLTFGPEYWWRDTLVNILNGEPLEQSLKFLQQKAEAYLRCMENTPGEYKDHYKDCMLQIDPIE